MLGKGGCFVRTKGGIAAEEHVGDDGQCRKDESGGVCRETCGPDVDGCSVAGVFEDFGDDVAKGDGEGGLCIGLEALVEFDLGG